MGMDSLYGFGILLLIPLLLWFQRSRWKKKKIILSISPIIEPIQNITSAPSSRVARLSKRWRYFLLAMAFLLLSLAFNRLHLRNMKDVPGEWLVVMDNPFTANATVEKESLFRIGLEELGQLTKNINSHDTYSLFITSPGYELQPGLNRRSLLSALEGRTPAYPFPSSTEAVELTKALLNSTPFKGTIVISPRDHQWRKDLKDDDSTRPLIFSEETPPLYGNTGIVAFDLSPSGAETFDLFFRTISRGHETSELIVQLHLANGSILDLPVSLDKKGDGRVVAKGLVIPPGEVSLELDVDDLLQQDDSLTATIAPGTANYLVDLGKQTRPFIKKALLSEKRIRAVDSGIDTSTGPFIKILDGELPEQGDAGPYLIIFPTGDFSGFSFKKILTAPLIASFDPLHSITRQLRFRDFRPSKVTEFQIPESFEVIGDAEGTPLIAVGEIDGSRVVVWSFDPEDNGIYLDPSFPILALESVKWLANDQRITWDRGLGCAGETRRGKASPGPQGEKLNILCAEVTLGASVVTVPKLPGLSLSDPLHKIEVRTDLTRPCLVLALIILLLLAADSAIGSRKLP
ncbi:MAG: hypothetical protein RRA15_09215 [bacterium]|nr:hypothetical protein [bacterium]MDT8366660.1 hypothetical protein [bacterium]